jgi:hypothetical protein
MQAENDVDLRPIRKEGLCLAAKADEAKKRSRVLTSKSIIRLRLVYESPIVCLAGEQRAFWHLRALGVTLTFFAAFLCFMTSHLIPR